METNIRKIVKLLLPNLLIILFFMAFTPISRDKKVALIVAIHDYPEQTEGFGWQDIAADQDILYLKGALIKQGFSSKNIIVLKNENATKRNILKTLEKTLPNNLEKGGTCFIHFSTHGQQIFDQNGDEPDQLDEAIVTYHAQRKYQKGKYEGAEHLRDEDITNALFNLRKKLGSSGQVLVNIDACNSGSGLRTKNEVTPRGSQTIIAPEGFLKKNKSVSISPGFGLMNDRLDLAPLIAIYASGADELNYQMLSQGKQVGSLTYAFCKAFADVNSNTTYQMLFDRIRQIMYRNAPKQTPQIEGKLNQLVLGGSIKGVLPYFRISKMPTSKEIIVDQGIFQGLSPGTVIGLFYNNTHVIRKADLIRTGTVQSANLTKATIQLNTPMQMKRKEYEALKIFILKQNYANQLNIKVDHSLSNLDRKFFLDKIKTHPAFELGLNTNIIVTIDQGKFQLLNIDGTLIFQNTNKQKVWDFFFKYFIADFMRNISSERNHLKAELKMIPIDDSINDPNRKELISKGVYSQESITDNRGNYILSVGTDYRFQISNTSMHNLYYAVVEVDAQHNTKLLVPSCRPDGFCYYLKDLKIKPGVTHTYAINMEITPLLGTNFLKLITSTSPIQIQEVLKTRSSSEKSFDTDNPLNHLLQMVTAEKKEEVVALTRSKKKLVITTKNIHIETILYETVKKNK